MDLTVLSPLLITGAAALMLMLVVAWERSHECVAAMTALALSLAVTVIPFVMPLTPRHVTTLLLIDAYGLFFMALVVSASLVVCLLSYAYWKDSGLRYGEHYILLLLATLGGEVLVTSHHFASFFLGLELLSVSLYGLVAYARSALRALEAGIKYLILSATASTFVVFGMAVTYFELGTLEFHAMESILQGQTRYADMILVGFAMVLIGITFKLGLIPFHMWAPDVYEGASAPVTAFVATVSKGAVMGWLLRHYLQMDMFRQEPVVLMISAIAVGSMFLGNWMALLQENIKRLLAYSSIAHMGYVLVALLASGPMAVEAIGYYLVAYIPTTLGAFGIIAALSRPGWDTDSLAAYSGLYWRQPRMAVMLTVMMLSLAGIPLTAGFLAKFYVVTAGLTADRWALVMIFVLNSVIGLFYYLRVILVMLSAESPAAHEAAHVPWLTRNILGVLTLVVLGFGIYPQPIMKNLQQYGERLLHEPPVRQTPSPVKTLSLHSPDC